MGYIYVIENNINHKKYVGQTIDPKNRWKAHKNDDIKIPNLVLGKAFKKYGVENFTFTIIEECENDLMSERERYWIGIFNTCVKDENSWGYNMTHGGESLFGEDNPFFGKKHSEETKKKLSKIVKERFANPENNPFYGKHHTEDTKKLISQKNTGRIMSDEERRRRSEINSGENNPFYGKKHSQETKAKISEKCQNRIPYNARKWIAYNDKEEILFLSISKIMEWLKINGYIKENEHFTMSMLKHRLSKSESKNIKFMEYYWKKSVETIESIDD